MRIRKTVLAFGVAVAALFAAAVSQAATVPLIHPDGGARTFRGFGPTQVNTDGYGCTLYNELGVKVGSIVHHYGALGPNGLPIQNVVVNVAGGSMTLVGEGPLGVMGTGELGDVGSEIPPEYNNADYGILIFSGRVEDGMDIDFTQANGIFRNAGVVEARCVFIVPLHPTPGNPGMLPVFCLNCVYSIS